MNSKIRFRLAAYTDPAGKWNDDAPKRGNEDDLFVDADLSNEVQGQFMADEVMELSDAGCLMVVADGMGGMNAGEVASAIAIQTVKSAFSKENIADEVLKSGRSRTKYLEKVVVDADAAIKKRSRADKECEGMGSTLIMAWLYDNELTVTWCGDSRAYQFREAEGIRQISKDHSYVQGLVDSGKITEVEAFDHPYGNIITRSLGDPEKKAEPDSVTVPVCKGDIILLCSDGLSGVLRDRKSYDSEGNLIPGDNLEDIIRPHRASMTECREALWAAAENAGWYDNVTAILCEIVEGEECPVTQPQDDKEHDNSVKDSMGRSFISIRVPKKIFKAVCIAVAAVLFCVAAFFAYQKFACHGSHQKDIRAQLDSLLKVSDSLGITFISEKIGRIDIAKFDAGALTCVKDELDARKGMLSKLDSLSQKADTLGLTGIAKVISGMKDSIKRADTPVLPDDIQKLETCIDSATSLLEDIEKFLEHNKSIPGEKRRQIERFRETIVQKDCINEDDIEKWTNISKLPPKSLPLVMCKK